MPIIVEVLSLGSEDLDSIVGLVSDGGGYIRRVNGCDAGRPDGEARLVERPSAAVASEHHVLGLQVNVSPGAGCLSWGGPWAARATACPLACAAPALGRDVGGAGFGIAGDAGLTLGLGVFDGE